MSEPEEIESQPTETVSGATSTADVPMDTATAIDQLRTLVCGLGVGLLVVSLAFTAFVYKQNRNLIAGTTMHQRQIARLQANERAVNPLVNALIRYSSGKPELMALLARHGLQINPGATTNQPPP
jgi:hypothetical protein